MVVHSVQRAFTLRARLLVVSRARLADVIWVESFCRALSNDAGELESLYQGISRASCMELSNPTFHNHDMAMPMMMM
jgi:hypothetical protein